MFYGYFLLKKANYPIFVFVLSLFSAKKSLKVVSFSQMDKTLSLTLLLSSYISVELISNTTHYFKSTAKSSTEIIFLS